MKFKAKVIDFYLGYPVLTDLLTLIILQFLYFKKHTNLTLGLKENELFEAMSNITNISVSLSGFILAALTIIIAFRANIRLKDPEESLNALELIFNTSHYRTITSVFRWSLIELCFWSILSHFTFIYHTFLNYSFFENVFVSTSIILFMALIRSLFTLFIIISLDHSK